MRRVVVKVLRPCVIRGRKRDVGEILQVSEAEASSLVSSGRAVIVVSASTLRRRQATGRSA